MLNFYLKKPLKNLIKTYRRRNYRLLAVPKNCKKALNISLCIYYLTRCLIQYNFSEIYQCCIGHCWQFNDFVGIFRRNFRCKTIEASRIGVARFLVLRRCPETGVRRQGRRILEGGHHTRPAPPNAPSQDSIRTSFGAD